MSDKPEALRLADVLCRQWQPTLQAAAAELRGQYAELRGQQAEIERLHAEIEEWRAKAAAWIASPEAAQRLDGYRELAQMAERAETERDALRAELREATAATNDPAVNNLRTLPESIRMLRAERDELLEALKLMRERFLDTDGTHSMGQQEATDAADAAIAKTMWETP